MSAWVSVDSMVCTATPSRETRVTTVSPALASAARVTRRSTPLLELPSSAGSSVTLLAFGAAVSTNTTRSAEKAPTLPAASVAIARRLWLPSASAALVYVQTPLALAVTVPSRVAPS